jgi:prepilin-type N-terminal cleavage/methylation domain-containing protein
MSYEITPQGEAEAGYTLVEMMAALVILSLTMTALIQASAQISRLQSHAAANLKDGADRARLQARFQQLFDHAGPFRSTDSRLDGDRDDFQFGCGGRTCGASLQQTSEGTLLRLHTPAQELYPLGRLHNPNFTYVDSAGPSETWPPERLKPQRLQSVLLASEDGRGFNAIATARIWRQEDADCRFDAILGDCRRSP